MLFINYDKALATKLGVTREHLEQILENSEDYYAQLDLHDPAAAIDMPRHEMASEPGPELQGPFEIHPAPKIQSPKRRRF